MALDSTQLRLVDALMTLSAELEGTIEQWLGWIDNRTGCAYDPEEVWSWIEQHDSSPSREREHC